jgi:hypothetical protein
LVGFPRVGSFERRPAEGVGGVDCEGGQADVTRILRLRRRERRPTVCDPAAGAEEELARICLSENDSNGARVAPGRMQDPTRTSPSDGTGDFWGTARQWRCHPDGESRLDRDRHQRMDLCVEPRTWRPAGVSENEIELRSKSAAGAGLHD